MQKKLTLRMSKEIIDAAKKYAAKRGTSLSKLVSTYLGAIASKHIASTDTSWKDELSPLTKNLIGLGQSEGSMIDQEEEYYAHLEEKHSRHLDD